ncbi:MAG: ABC transporter permease [Gemmatimonadaceae bacterium]|nr:ABC transporter permease [Gemmatimonadaceae bacterium]MCW5827238.1 ABC transporter permease [Gemmatimonadaceae bacterium]
MASWIRDISLGLRTLRKSPGLTIVASIALMFGIGLTTMMFSIVYGALMRGLPFEDGDRIVTVWRTNPRNNITRQSLPIHDFSDVVQAQRSFTQFGAYTSGTMNVSGEDRAERYSGTWITVGALEMAGIQPSIGRTFRPGEDAPGGPRVAILGYAMWRDRFGRSPSVIGQTMRVNSEPYEIIGVMPEGFRFPNDGELWLPLQTDPLATARGNGPYVNVIGKLAPGVSIDAASAELATIYGRLAADYPESNRDFSAYAMEFTRAFIGNEASGLLYTMLGAVFFVLLIACANVANLLLDRAAHRSKEVGVRSALGASRGQIVRIFLAEAFVLSLLGTVLGIIVAKVGLDAFTRAIVDTNPPFFLSFDLYGPVLAFSIGVSLLAALMSGLIPAFQASRGDIAEILKDESRGASGMKIGKLSKALVVFEISLSCGLLVAAGLMIKSVVKANSRDTGFAMESVFTSRVGFPSSYTDTVMQRTFWEQLPERVAAIPGVQATALASGLPSAEQGFGQDGVMIEGRTYNEGSEVGRTRLGSVSSDFLKTLEIPLSQGRSIDDTDRDGALPVAIVNERFVREHFPDGDALGKRVKLGGIQPENQNPYLTIVGVFGDVMAGDPEDPRPALLLRPLAQARPQFAYIAARTAGDPMSLAPGVREAVASLNPDIPIYWPMTLREAAARQLWFVRVFGTMFAIFGLVALFLASIGLYAVMSFAVSRRTREMGIRMALGSSPGRVIRLVFSSGAWQLGLGMALGLALAAGISRLLTVILYDVQPLDPIVFSAVALTLGVAGALACFIPAQRATRADPAVAMRAE